MNLKISSMSINKNNIATRFLIYSFIGLLFFSIAVFSLLGIYMSRKSKKTVYEIEMCIRDRSHCAEAGRLLQKEIAFLPFL